MLMNLWCVVGEGIDNKNKVDIKVFTKTFARADKIVKIHSHIDGKKIVSIENGVVDSSELGTCSTKTSYLGKNVYVTRSLNTCSVCVQDGVTACGMCDRFEPLDKEPPEKVTCPMCGYRCSRPMKEEKGWNYGEHDDNYRSKSKQKNTNHCFCPKCWGIHNKVTRKIIRHKDGFLIPVVKNPQFRPPQDQYSAIYDPDKNAVR